MLLFVFKCITWNNFYTFLVIIFISNEKERDWRFQQYYVIMTRHFFRKRYHHFFKCRNWYTYHIYIVTTEPVDFKQLYLFYKFYSIKQKFFYLNELHIGCSLLTIQVKHNYTFPSLSVFYFTESKCLKFL